jgi:hypothetical protein
MLGLSRNLQTTLQSAHHTDYVQVSQGHYCRNNQAIPSIVKFPSKFLEHQGNDESVEE